MRTGNILVDRLWAGIGAPKTDDVDGYISEYLRATKGAPKQVLDAAATHLITHQKYRSWPTVGEVMTAVSHAVSDPNAGKVLPPAIDNFGVWWDDKIRRAEVHSNDRELRDLFSEVRPYAETDMIARWRWDELLRCARHDHETARAIGIDTPLRLLDRERVPQPGRPRWLDERREPKTEESRARVRELAQSVQFSGLRPMPEPDAEDYRNPEAWENEIPYEPRTVQRPDFQRMQAKSSNMVHRTPHGLTELSKRMTGEVE